jgi:hypothetical protein
VLILAAVSIPHTVRRVGAAINPEIRATKVSKARVVKHGRNPSSSCANDRGRLSALRTAHDRHTERRFSRRRAGTNVGTSTEVSA